MAEHKNIRLKLARGISVNVCDLRFKSVDNLVGSCALRCRSAVHDVHRSMLVSECQPLDWFNGSYGVPLILSLKYTKITTFLQNTSEPINMPKRFQNIIIIS